MTLWNNITDGYYRIISWHHITEFYHGMILRNHITEIYYRIISRNHIRDAYYGIVVWTILRKRTCDYVTELDFGVILLNCIYVIILYSTELYYGIILRNYPVEMNPGSPDTSPGPLGTPRTSWGPLWGSPGDPPDHKNNHISTNSQRQKLLIADL